MIFTDHLNGDFTDFETEIGKGDDGLFFAKAMGYAAKSLYQDQALNDLNIQIYEAISKGELVPNGV